MGGSISWLYSWYPVHSFTRDRVSIEDVLKYSSTPITEANFSCEGDTAHNVGAVIASMMELNNTYKRNMLSFGCYQNICTLMLSSCMPWQWEECGNRILKFEIDDSSQIQTSTFSCIDIP